ncbi:OsmC family peroxiredoxin [Mumia sp. zg.B53]|uniref:OsmC family peroxiredoxin n=1 Tax=unclassified Mumia TaxID=2621872 RepID=UPI001C6E8112|nr:MULTISPECIES: OsmC family peroxiredoxin [unclassified Mumia]MBW9208281.1 OsmC family peroxiredoxin [Mumia sp. zg.B21]MBW9216238.1 OsmC family peroxiredoxin [Mumia sp. zg.B53]MDD9348748.1 OsmC family peroxiredoxin [Mumia sp.]
MATRTATTQWTGGLQDGSGRVNLDTSGAGSYEVSFPRRIADEAEGVTSPEELLAAAHAACYAMALSGGIAKAGGTPQSSTVRADVTVRPDREGGGLLISTITLTVRAKVDGLTAEQFTEVAEQTKKDCPVSKALASVPEIELDAALES